MLKKMGNYLMSVLFVLLKGFILLLMTLCVDWFLRHVAGISNDISRYLSMIIVYAPAGLSLFKKMK